MKPFRWSLILCLVLISFARADAAPRSDSIYPATTKGYLSVPDVDLLREKFNATQIGKLLKDPVMKPFAEDLRRQINEKLSESGKRLGIRMSDLDGVYGGEVSFAAIQPNGDSRQHALALLVDVTGHHEEANELLKKVEKDLVDRGGKKAAIKEGDVVMTTYAVPTGGPDMEMMHIFYVIVADHLVAVDHEETARGVVRRLIGKDADAKQLAGVEAYVEAMKKCDGAAGDVAPQIRWFIEPFGYAEVLRASENERQRGRDMLKILQGQGFTAIQGLGGHITFSTTDHEILHRTFIYAPAVLGLAEGQKYPKSASMLDFPNTEMADDLTPQAWIPRKAATHVTFKWKLEKAFWAAEGLVDDIVGATGAFDDVMKALQHDPMGPKINVPGDLVANLSERATFVSDYKLPITPKSERWMVAVELKDGTSPIVAMLVDKAMRNDPDAKEREHKDITIWEILNEEEDDELGPIEIGGPGLGGFGGVPAVEEEEEEEKPILPNSAITVAQGHLILASHVDFITQMLDEAAHADTLAAAEDYRVVKAALEKLGGGQDSFRVFTRTDEATRPTYELIRQGKMPEAETLFGKLLNRMLAPDEEGELREQQIDGKKMPAFPVVRRHLGPSGIYVKSLDDGWIATGCLLTKEIK